MKQLLLHIFLLPCLISHGNPVSSNISDNRISSDSARIAAERFLLDRQCVMSSARTRSIDNKLLPVKVFIDNCHVFNVEGGGFVIVNESSQHEVLGYSDDGYIDINNIPEGLYSLLGTKQRIAKSEISQTISPLISTIWGQNEPFNTFCPNNSATGCVATAMAQVMAYYCWPQLISTAIPAYSSYESLPPISFDWSLFSNKYESYDETGEVARLMLYCGMSVETNYGSTSTASESLIPVALRKYFEYDASVRRVVRSDFTALQWDSLLTRELLAGHPIIYRGVRSTGSSHEFIIDGRDTDGLYHINWGWQGKSNGWFRLPAANPYYTGTGGGTGHDGYSLQQSAIVGIFPDAGGMANESEAKLTVEELNIYMPTLQERAANGHARAKIQCVWANHSEQEKAMYYGIGVYQDGKLVEPIKLGALNFKPGTTVGRRKSGEYADYELSYGIGLTGEVSLIPIYGSGIPIRWKPAEGSDRRRISVQLDETYAQMTVHPNHNLTVTNVDFRPISTDDYGLQHVEVTIQNDGEEYDGRLYLEINDSIVSVNGFILPQNTMTTIDFIYIPSEGIQNYRIGLSQNEQIYPGIISEGISTVHVPTCISPLIQVQGNKASYTLNGIQLNPSLVPSGQNKILIISKGKKHL